MLTLQILSSLVQILVLLAAGCAVKLCVCVPSLDVDGAMLAAPSFLFTSIHGDKTFAGA